MRKIISVENIKTHLFLLILVLVSCGPDAGHFKLDGKLLNLNQGEFLVYSTDGAITGVDTITVMGGRFTYEAECEQEGTIVIMMPGGQEIPVFVKPGKTFSLNGDAHNLKEIKVAGSKENELMNDFRKKTAAKGKDTVPLDEINSFIKGNPESAVGKYLVVRYLLGEKPNYPSAQKLLKTMLDKRPDNASLKVLYTQVKDMEKVSNGKRLPSFTATDLNGKGVTQKDISKGLWIVTSIASWDFESTNQIRRIKTIVRDEMKDINIMAISFDVNKKLCETSIAFDTEKDIVLFDGKMAESPIASCFGIRQTGIAIVISDGKILERSLYGEPLYTFLKEEIKGGFY